MDEKEWRAEIQALAAQFRAHKHVNMSEVARKSGFSPAGLRNFIKDGVGGFEKVKKLGEILDGLRSKEQPAGIDEKSALDLLVQDLEALLGVLKSSNQPYDLKTRKIIQWIRFSYENLGLLTEALEDQGNGNTGVVDSENGHD